MGGRRPLPPFGRKFPPSARDLSKRRTEFVRMSPTPADEEKLAGFLSPAFDKAAFRVNRRLPLTFICGGKNSGDTAPLRHQFLNQISCSPRRILPILAERAFPHQLIERNIQKFEEFLGKTADCVLIFAESPGSFAETGMFAALHTIALKTIVINTRREAREISFLNLGPIKLIRRLSRFDCAIDLATAAVTDVDATAIVDAITSTYQTYKTALVFQPEDKFIDLPLRLQLACVQMAVTVLRAASTPLITAVLRDHFGAVEEDSIERFLSLLTSISLLEREDELYFVRDAAPFSDDSLICTTQISMPELRVRALEWHAEKNSHVSTFLREKLGVDI
ncbi:MAG: retron St85 family effector protein [Candidatus Acidiferrales bacterium]